MRRHDREIAVEITGLALLVAVTCSHMSNAAATNEAPGGTTVQDLLNRGQAYVHQGKYDLALAEFTKAIELDKTNAQAYVGRSGVYLMLAAAGMFMGSTNMTLRKDSYSAALSDCDKAISLDPTNTSFRTRRGMILGLGGRFQEGRADLAKATETSPSDSQRYLDSARLFGLAAAQARMTGNDDAASANEKKQLADLSKAIELAPLAPNGYMSRADFYLASQPDLALADMQKAIELQPTNAFLHRNLAAMYEAWGKSDAALAEYNKAVDLDPRDASSYADRGKFHAKHGKYALAMTDFNRAVELDPTRALSFAARAGLYDKQGDAQRALADWDKTVELSPNSGFYRQQRDKCSLKAQASKPGQ